MSEHSPTRNRRFTDDELIAQSIDLFNDIESPIDNATARVISSQFHGGQNSDLYSLASTGHISPDLLYEINRTYEEFKDQPEQQRKLGALAVYVADRRAREDTEAVEGWSKLWLEAPSESDDLCHCCFEHISSPHAVGCPLGVDDEELLERVQQLRAESGVHLLHWLSYVGFRNLDELNQAADQFAEHYHGFYDSVLDYAQEIAANLDNPPSVRELVAEINRTMYIAEGLHGGVYIYDK